MTARPLLAAIWTSRSRNRRPGRVPVRGHHPPGQVPVIQVHGQDRRLPQARKRGSRRRRGAPARVEVPPAPHRVIADIVTDRTSGRLRSDLTAPVAELHGARQPVPAARPVRQPGQRGGQPDLQPALLRVPPQRLVPPRLVLLPVCGQEQPGRLPPAPPLLLRKPSGGQAAAGAQQRPAAPPPTAPPRPAPTPAAGSAPAPRPGQRPRTTPPPDAATSSPGTTPHDHLSYQMHTTRRPYRTRFCPLRHAGRHNC